MGDEKKPTVVQMTDKPWVAVDLDGRFQNVNKVVNDIYAWAKTNQIPVDYVWPMPKPASIICFFDDRAIEVAPAHEFDQHDQGWNVALATFERRYAAKIPNWLREVTPK